MRVTCIALAAVALALAKYQAAPGHAAASGTTYQTYALSAAAPARAGAEPAPAAPAAAAAGTFDYTPLPEGGAAPDGGPAPAPAAVLLSPRSDTARCVTVRRGERAPTLVVAACGAGEAQGFAFVGGALRTAGDLCVTAPDDGDNAVRPVSLEPCDGSTAQQWTATPAGEFRGYRGKCLTAAAGLQRRQGTPLAVRGCMGRSDQQWGQRVAVDSIRLNAVALSVSVGRTVRVNALAVAPDGRELHEVPVTWTSADPAVADVSADGVVRGVGSGSTSVVAMSHGRVQSVPVEVRGAQYAGAESGTATWGADRP